MGMIFNNVADACTYLYVRGYRQNDAGEWMKGKKFADIRTLVTWHLSHTGRGITQEQALTEAITGKPENCQ